MIKNNGNIKFLQPYPAVPTDALFENCMAEILVVFSLDEHLLRTDTFHILKCYQLTHCCLIGTSYLGYALISALRTAANHFVDII
jgi:hypothetical protein